MADNGKKVSIQFPDTSLPKKLPKDIKSIDYTIDGNVIVLFKNGHAEKMKTEEAIQKGYISNTPLIARDTNKIRNCLFIIDGKEMPMGSNLDKLDPTDIKTIQIFSDDTANCRYGEKGRNGVIVITTRNKELKNSGKDTPAPRKDLGVNSRNPFNKESNPNIFNEVNS